MRFRMGSKRHFGEGGGGVRPLATLMRCCVYLKVSMQTYYYSTRKQTDSKPYLKPPASPFAFEKKDASREHASEEELLQQPARIIGRNSGPFPSAVAHRPLLSALTAAIK